MKKLSLDQPLNLYGKMVGHFKIFQIFFLLGLSSFGGPTAHIGYLHSRFVVGNNWFSAKQFFELVSICQFLPGPTSSQVVYAIGLIRKGLLGGVLAWLGFTLPSAIILIVFAYGMNIISSNTQFGFMQGLISVSVPVVGIALWQMGRSLCIDKFHWLIVITSVAVLMALGPAVGHLVVVIFGLISGLFLKFEIETFEPSNIQFVLGNRLASFLVILFFFILALVFVLAQMDIQENLKLFPNLYKTGALVFGGGHVVLPLLEADFVPTKLLDQEQFFAGYGLAQAIPGPLFAFVSYCGTLMHLPNNNFWVPTIFGFICLFCIYLPTFLLIPPALFFWSRLRENYKVRAALSGINAAVVGLLVHAFVFHILPFSFTSSSNTLLAVIGFVLLGTLKLPSWSVVLSLSLSGWALQITLS